MSYEPTTWKDGDLVTSEKLNKLEQGVASATSGGGATSPTANLVAIMGSDQYLNKTWQEICDENIFIIMGGSGLYKTYLPIVSMYPSDDYYIFAYNPMNSSSTEPIVFTASTATDYPHLAASN